MVDEFKTAIKIYPMNNEVLHLQANNVICEGYGCFNKATTKINVKVGQLGTIPLDLCADCVKKFDVNKNVLEQVEELFSNTNQNVQPVSIQGVRSRQ
jgi:hypothetical protein